VRGKRPNWRAPGRGARSRRRQPAQPPATPTPRPETCSAPREKQHTPPARPGRWRMWPPTNWVQRRQLRLERGARARDDQASAHSRVSDRPRSQGGLRRCVRLSEAVDHGRESLQLAHAEVGDAPPLATLQKVRGNLVVRADGQKRCVERVLYAQALHSLDQLTGRALSVMCDDNALNQRIQLQVTPSLAGLLPNVVDRAVQPVGLPADLVPLA